MRRLTRAATLALSALLPCHAVSAATYSIATRNITGGGVSVDDFLDGMVPFFYLGPNTDLVGGYIGVGGAGLPAGSYDANGIGSLDWYGSPVSLYTASANLGDAYTVAGSVTGGPVPTGTLDSVAGTITMDLSSLFGTWNDGDYIAGTGRPDGVTSAMAVGTWDPGSLAYTLYWDSLVFGPACSPCVSHWTLHGVASPVPAPAAFWLFGSGLLGLISVQCRRSRTRQISAAGHHSASGGPLA